MATTEGMARSRQLWRMPWLEFAIAATMAIALTVGLVDSAAWAATRYVATSGNNGGNSCLASGAPCKTITHALSQAVADDTISVAAGTYNLALGETFPLTINKALTLTGAGAASTVIDGGQLDSVFTVVGAAPPARTSATIAHVTIHNGKATAGNGGGINIGLAGTLHLVNSVLIGNSAVNGGGIYNSIDGVLTVTDSTLSNNSAHHGGGIFNDGTLTVTSSTLSGNSVSGGGSEGGALDNHFNGLTVITNSTFSGNSAPDPDTSGSGIFNIVGVVHLVNSTITNNTANPLNFYGSGLANFNGTITLHNSIVAKQATGSDCANTGTLTSNGFNLDSDNTCQLAQPSDHPGVGNPLLGPLQNNGGPTQTHALLPGSPAIDAGTSTGCPATDQRGITRPQGSACDIGAFEVAASTGPGPAARQLLHVATFVGPTVPPTPQQQQQAFRTTDPILAGATYYDPNPACLGVPPAGVKFFVFTLEGHLTLGRNRDTTGGISSTQIGTSNYQALLATLGPGVLPPGAYNAVFWVTDCTNTAILVSEFAALQVLGP